MNLIPKVKISDKATYVKAETIAVSVEEFLNLHKRFLKHEYFEEKKVIVLSIMPDEAINYYSYSDLLVKLTSKIDLNRLILMSADCMCYQSEPEICEDEITYMLEENHELFERFDVQIGMLKGHNFETYYHTALALTDNIKDYMIYLTGEIRSNPRHFNLVKWVKKFLPKGLDKPVYFHGCPKSQFKHLKEIDLNVKGIITAGHISDAIYRSNPRYKRETRIRKSWDVWVSTLESCD